jgi:hypothetical protein
MVDAIEIYCASAIPRYVYRAHTIAITASDGKSPRRKVSYASLWEIADALDSSEPWLPGALLNSAASPRPGSQMREVVRASRRYALE